MTKVTIDLPSALEAEARQAGLSVSLIVEQALVTKLAGLPLERAEVEPSASSHSDGGDDASRYSLGFALGRRWARTASLEEVAEVAKWSRYPWRQFAIDPGANSLAAAMCDASGDRAPGGYPFWVERNAYTSGIVDAVAAAHSRAVGV